MNKSIKCATPINLSILDFKPEKRKNNKGYWVSINLSILDFKLFSHWIILNRIIPINLSILDFKQNISDKSDVEKLL